ncbi:MAG: hypothetical protein JWR19_2423, partial [Pedosphaera sp.]|nr:hypothetical protein [Pedosphaera sp.]
AIGHLILDGQVNGCLYVFTGAGTNNAIYVDLLELSNFATNGPIANLPALQVDPNMMIYYADAQIGGVEVSEKLNGANGGRLCWVSNYAGIYSSTNVTYPSGKTYTLNRALVTSTNIDSNGDGIKNNVDPAPVILPDQIALSMTITNLPPLTTLISWQAPAYATNYLFSRTNLFSTNLTVVTNFVQGPVKGNITVADPVKASGPVFYQLRVDPH